MKKPIHFIAGGIAVVALAIFLLTREGPKSPGDVAPVPTRPLALTNLTTMDNQTIALAEWKDRHILMHFWGAWCGPCVEEFPQLARLAKANPGWEFVMVSTDRDKLKLTNFLVTMEARTQIPLRTLPNVHFVWDSDRYISQGIYRVKRYPTTLVTVPPLQVRQTLEAIPLHQCRTCDRLFRDARAANNTRNTL